MGYKLEDLIDVNHFQSLQEKLNNIYSFPSAIIDNDGKVLTAVAWQDICTKFHRQHPESERECIKSDQYILEHLYEANPAVSYKCPHGLIDNATPIIIDGKHLGNFFTGQFFLEEKPDIDFFRRQAKKYGFDEEEYLDAVNKVPVWTREKLEYYLDFIKGFIEVIAGIGLKNLREIESKNAMEIANKKLLDEIEERKHAEKLLRDSEQRYHKLFDQANEGLLLMTMDGKIAEVNLSFASMHGYTVDELRAMNIKELDVLKEGTFEIREEIMRRIHNGEVVRFEVEHYHKNGNIITFHVTTSIINIGDQNFFLAFHQDINERKQHELLLQKKNEEITAQNEKLYQTNLELIAAKEKAEESEIKYRIQFQNMSSYNSIYEVITDDQGRPYDFRFLMVNQAYENYVGKKADDLIGKTLLEVYPETEQYWIDKMAEAVLTGRPLYFENYSKVMDTYTDIELYIPQKGQLAMITSNINDRKKAETALRKSESIKNAMVSNISDVIVIIDKDGINQYKSPNITKLFGWLPEELVGKNTWDNVHPDDLDAGQKFLGSILNEPNASGTTEIRYKCKDGNYVWIEISVINLLHDKDIQGILGNYHEITERKRFEEELTKAKEKAEESEYRLKLAAESGKFGIWDWNVKDNVMIWDERMFELYGITNDTFTETIDAWLNGLHPEDKQRALDECAAALSGERDFDTTFRVLHPDGKVLFLKAEALVIKDTAGKAVRMIGLNMDVTEIMLAETELENHRNHLEELVEIRTKEIDEINQQLKKEIQEKNKAQQLLSESLEKEKELCDLKSRFISTASHEFRTPLTSILMSTGLIQRYYKKWDESKTDEHLTRVILAVQNLTRIIDEVITLNRADAGKLNLSLQKTDLKELCERNIDESDNTTLGKYKIKLSYSCPEKQYLLDPKQIDVILQNLLSNAVKYSQEGSCIKVKVMEKKNNIILTVADEGIGIPEEELPQLFEPFHRAKNAEAFQGSGLGLSIVKSAVKLHGGNIKVNSVVNKGTTFTVDIPIKATS